MVFEHMAWRLVYICLMCLVMRSLKTIQNITQIGGHKKITMILITLETLIFLLVFKNILTGELTFFIIIAVALGYIMGYLIGSFIEDKIALGKVKITIKIAKEKSKDLSKVLKENGFIFIQSKRYYSHKGKLRKLHQGIIYRNELPKLKAITKGFNIVASVENLKATFGKRIISSKEYLELDKI